ncbi:DUF2782 domain-containing protein [Endozoicomonas sp. Mp262]|uniref:DUF2782 domain-containing protein n=1 Tax=Endozoicomonas sp. Mp262 TaxID=2919499 RepID=UPI0021D92855
MKYRLLGIVIPLVLAGCTSPSPTSPDVQGKSHGKEASPTETLTKELKRLPKDLRPEDLERRDDTTVVIRESKEHKIKEYRVAGVLYGIQVIPKVGSPYFLIPAKDPNFFIRQDKPDILIPSWQVFKWK